MTNTANTPKRFTIEQKTFTVKNGTVTVSMYDRMSRIFKLEKKAAEYGLKIIYTH